MISLVLIMILSYLAGSIPFSIILSRLSKGIDIRDYGSGNAGASNTIRILGWKIGIVVIFFDVAKGVVATVLISQLRIDPLPLNQDLIQICAGFCSIIGHIWTVFAGFRGGKGVATGGGMIFALYPLAASISLIIFLTVLLTVRIVSVSSICAALSFPLVILILKIAFGYPVSSPLFYFSILAAALIVFTHRSNIKRLMRGEENRFKKFGKKNK